MVYLRLYWQITPLFLCERRMLVNFIKEIKVPSINATFRPGAIDILVKVFGCFDLHKILQKIMPKSMVYMTTVTSEDNGVSVNVENHTCAAMYEARFIRYSKNDPFVFIMNIEQFDKNKVEEMAMNENPAQRANLTGVIYY